MTIRKKLQHRADILKTVRAFFDDRGFVSVDPPVFQTCPSFDPHIHAFSVFDSDMYLRTSPELEMKKMLSQGAGDIYTIGPNFRRDNDSDLHRPEFTMIEWYRVNVDYTAIMDDCINLLRAVSDSYTYQGKVCDPHKEWRKISVCEAFQVYLDIDLNAYLSSSQRVEFYNMACSLGVSVRDDDTWDDIFCTIIAEKIEPHLGRNAPCILYDYPKSLAALSREKQSDPRFAERFEVYVCGVELANAFSELTDPIEQRNRFKRDMALRKRLYNDTYPSDESFFKALEAGLPNCAGIALGIDRLIMLAGDQKTIQL